MDSQAEIVRLQREQDERSNEQNIMDILDQLRNWINNKPAQRQSHFVSIGVHTFTVNISTFVNFREVEIRIRSLVQENNNDNVLSVETKIGQYDYSICIIKTIVKKYYDDMDELRKKRDDDINKLRDAIAVNTTTEDVHKKDQLFEMTNALTLSVMYKHSDAFKSAGHIEGISEELTYRITELIKYNTDILSKIGIMEKNIEEIRDSIKNK